MPAGDPAGYLPNVKKARRYRPRARQRLKQVRPGAINAALNATSTGGTRAPNFRLQDEAKARAESMTNRSKVRPKRRPRVRTLPAVRPRKSF